MLAFASPQHQSPTLNPYTYYDSMHGRQQQPSADIGGDFFRETIRELAQQRARKAQWLPDEVDDSDEESDYTYLGPHEHRYIEPLKAQQNMDRIRNDHEARATAMQEAEKLRQAEEERARKLQMESHDARRRAIDQMFREASDELNLRAERTRKQHEHGAFTGAGRNCPQSRPYSNPLTPIHVERTSGARSSSHKANPIPEPKSQSPPKSLYTEKHETAASAIQQQFRIHRSLHTVGDIASEFQTLKNGFEYPTVIEFQEPGTEEGHVSVSTAHSPLEFDELEEVVEEDEGEARMEVDGLQPKLAYTAVNYPVHSYVDAMEKLLMKLDGVESWGDKGVRESRRSVVREIGKESGRLERYWKQAWMEYAEKQREGAEEEQEVHTDLQREIEIDEELVHVEHPKVEDNDEWLDVAELGPAVPNGDAIEIEVNPSVFTEASTPSTLSDEVEVVEL